MNIIFKPILSKSITIQNKCIEKNKKMYRKKKIFNTDNSFVFLKKNGGVIPWGNPKKGGSLSINSFDKRTKKNKIIDVSNKLSSDVKEIFSTDDAFVALKNDGSIVSWGKKYRGNSLNVTDKLSSDIKKIFSNRSSFAALKEDGSVVTWGKQNSGGNSNYPNDNTNKLSSGVKEIFSTVSAFAAIKEDGSVVTWGNSTMGGDSDKKSLLKKLSSGVKEIFSNINTFAALKEDNSVVTWGHYKGVGNKNTDKLTSDVKTIFSTGDSFAALKYDNTIVTWGQIKQKKFSLEIKDIYTTFSLFAALTKDNSVVTWGDYGRDGFMAKKNKVSSGVKEIFSTRYAFAALKEDGSVVSWGMKLWGGDLGKVYDSNTINSINSYPNKLSSKVKKIYSTNSAFAALKEDGSVVTWGNASQGGNFGIIYNSAGFELIIQPFEGISNVNVIEIYSNGHAFVALKKDGSVFTWGMKDKGGNIERLKAKEIFDDLNS